MELLMFTKLLRYDRWKFSSEWVFSITEDSNIKRTREFESFRHFPYRSWCIVGGSLIGHSYVVIVYKLKKQTKTITDSKNLKYTTILNFINKSVIFESTCWISLFLLRVTFNFHDSYCRRVHSLGKGPKLSFLLIIMSYSNQSLN